MEKIYKKDDILETVIEDMSTDGLGVGKIDGYTLFVKDAVIGDTCIVKVMKAKKNYAYAHLEEVKNPSSFRITPLCKNAKACGGCQLQAMSYEAELKFKENKVENNLIRIGGFSKDFIESIKEPIVGMEERRYFVYSFCGLVYRLSTSAISQISPLCITHTLSAMKLTTERSWLMKRTTATIRGLFWTGMKN